jgi:hypothetical protein
MQHVDVEMDAQDLGKSEPLAKSCNLHDITKQGISGRRQGEE